MKKEKMHGRLSRLAVVLVLALGLVMAMAVCASAAQENVKASYTFAINNNALDESAEHNFSCINARTGYAVFEIPEALRSEDNIYVQLSVTTKAYPNNGQIGNSSLQYILLQDEEASSINKENAIAYGNTSKTYIKDGSMRVPTSGEIGVSVKSDLISIVPNNAKTIIICIPKPLRDDKNSTGNAGASFYNHSENNAPSLRFSTLVDAAVNYVDTEGVTAYTDKKKRGGW